MKDTAKWWAMPKIIGPAGADDPFVLYDEHLFTNMNRKSYVPIHPIGL